jgi:drug/metabolite transporter superfamily protein YnfA
MNKSIILLFAAAFEIAGSFIPMLFGNNDIFSAWGILGGLVGGIFGIWVGVVFSKRFL